VQGSASDRSAIPPSEAISYVHARIEISLQEVFGEDGYVAVRPGYFASNNVRQYKSGLEKGEVRMYGPNATVDNIVPSDIGRVCGTVLARGAPEDGERKLYLYGPELLSQKDTVGTLADVLGKKLDIVAIDEQDAEKKFAEEKVPALFVVYMLRRLGMEVDGQNVLGYPVGEGQLLNVEKYSGRKATSFKEWVEENKQLFLS